TPESPRGFVTDPGDGANMTEAEIFFHNCARLTILVHWVWGLSSDENGTQPNTDNRCPLPHLWCSSKREVRTGYWQTSHRTTPRPEIDRSRTCERADEDWVTTKTNTVLPVSPKSLRCPFCAAGRGKACKTSAGRNLRNAIGVRAPLIHVARITKAAMLAARLA